MCDQKVRNAGSHQTVYVTGLKKNILSHAGYAMCFTKIGHMYSNIAAFTPADHKTYI